MSYEKMCTCDKVGHEEWCRAREQIAPGLSRFLLWSLPFGIIGWILIAAGGFKVVSWALERPYHREPCYRIIVLKPSKLLELK